MFIDTLTMDLKGYLEGTYGFSVSFVDPSANMPVSRTKQFRIISLFDETAGKIFYEDIQYLVAKEDYRKFKALSVHERKKYLKEFWAKRDYWQFEKRLLEANAKFATPFLMGSDTEQGRVYIQLGPPDWIDFRAMEQTWLWEDMLGTKIGGSSQLWHYDSRGFRLLFCDSNDDGNYELLGAMTIKDEWREILKTYKEITGYLH
jgi:GWxTD domain-containing protein